QHAIQSPQYISGDTQRHRSSPRILRYDAHQESPRFDDDAPDVEVAGVDVSSAGTSSSTVIDRVIRPPSGVYGCTNTLPRLTYFVPRSYRDAGCSTCTLALLFGLSPPSGPALISTVWDAYVGSPVGARFSRTVGSAPISIT